MRRSIHPILLASLLAPLTAVAQPAPKDDARKKERASARATLTTFKKLIAEPVLDAGTLERAMACLDLSEVDEAEQKKVGAARVRQLKKILEHPQAKYTEVGIPETPNAEAFTLYKDPRGKGELVLDRVGKRGWLFTAETVEAIPGLLKALDLRKRLKAQGKGGPGAVAAKKPTKPGKKGPRYEHVSDWLQSHMPAHLRGRAFLLEYWQWMGLGLIALLGILLAKGVIVGLVAAIVAALEQREMDVDKDLTRTSVRPFGWLAMAAFWWLALGWLGLHTDVKGVVYTAVKTIAAIAVVWGLYNLVDVIGNAMERKALKSESKFDDLLVPLVRKTAKIFVVAFGLVFIADTLKFSVTSLLAGLSLGGLAFALAAKDTLSNFFGSLTVVLDRPFEVGDWVLIGKVEGSVEEVGFRSTRVRTFYNSIITLPNSTLLTATVDNMGKRRYRRWKTTLTVTYDTSPEKLQALCEGIRELIRNYPSTRKDYFQVFVTNLASSAIEVMIYVFFETPDWGRELRARERMIIDILKLARHLEVELAFPTQTLHVVRPKETNGQTIEERREPPPPVVREGAHTGRLAAALVLAQIDREEEERLEAEPQVALDPGGNPVHSSSDDTTTEDPADAAAAAAVAAQKPLPADSSSADTAAVSDEAGDGDGDGGGE